MENTVMTPDEARAKAHDLFVSGYNCTQSVIGTVCGELGLDFDQALKLAQPFGGGMGRMREVCGTVSGMLFALGAVLGSSDAADKKAKDDLYAAVQKLSGTFREKNGSIICRELLGLDKKNTAMTDPVSAPRTAEYYRKRPCADLAGDAAEIFQKWYIEEVLHNS
jgi:C_GCAxxG_C_C family probable redox protein